MNDFTTYCGCLDCATLRMKAATCKCGHVGAECFNDSYCEPATVAPIEQQLKKALDDAQYLRAENEAMRAAHNKEIQRLNAQLTFSSNKLSEFATNADDLQDKFAGLNVQIARIERTQAETIDELEADLEDLQAEYAEDMAWSDVEVAALDTHSNDQFERIIELESTIKVLSGLLSNS